MQSLEVIDDPSAAIAALDPMRARLLAELSTEPASAASLAAKTGLARQKINYHLRSLEEHGLVRVAEQRKWGGITESRFVASAASFVVSPDAMGPVRTTDPERLADKLSASYLIALAARMMREVTHLLGKSREYDKRLPTLSIDAEIRFATPADRAAFTEELSDTVRRLAAQYNRADGRAHRLVIVAHPLPAVAAAAASPSEPTSQPAGQETIQ